MPYRIAWEASGDCRTYFGELTDAQSRHSPVEICEIPRFDGAPSRDHNRGVGLRSASCFRPCCRWAMKASMRC